MKATLRGFILGAAVLALAAPLAAQEFAIDPVHSSAGFTVRHMVVSTVRGTFSGITGTIVLDREHPERSSVVAEIDAATIDTRNAERDAHLKSADFLDVERFPKIRFESTSVRREGDRWVARGRLTLHGVTREVELPFRLNGPIVDPWGNVRLGVEVEPITLDRKAFGITWNRTLDGGGLVVGNEVTVTLAVEAVAKPTPKAE